MAKASRHFVWQRLTAVVNLPLVLFFLASLLAHSGASYEAMLAFVSRPYVGGVLLLLIVSALIHACLGMQSVIDDYIHNKLVYRLAYGANYVFVVAVGVVSFIAVLKVMV